MASYCPITLPAVAAWRSYALSALARGGATVYQRVDGSYVASRASWPSPPEGPDPVTLSDARGHRRDRSVDALPQRGVLRAQPFDLTQPRRETGLAAAASTEGQRRCRHGVALRDCR